jgi:hypothetical protein
MWHQFLSFSYPEFKNNWECFTACIFRSSNRFAFPSRIVLKIHRSLTLELPRRLTAPVEPPVLRTAIYLRWTSLKYWNCIAVFVITLYKSIKYLLRRKFRRSYECVSPLTKRKNSLKFHKYKIPFTGIGCWKCR